MILRIAAIALLAVAGALYAWLNGWLSRRDEAEERRHAGQTSWA